MPNLYLFSQEERIQIRETEGINLCGHELFVDGIWMNEGIIRADISVLERPNSKPITGGYKRGDTLIIYGADSCKYFVYSITKSGLDTGKGTVILSNTPPAEYLPICEDTLDWKESSKNWFDTLDYKVTSISKGDDGKLSAEIDVAHKSALITRIILRENDVIWSGECIYRVTYLIGEMGISKGNKWEVEPGHLILTRQNFFIHSSNEEIKGLDNPPNVISISHFIIRKAQLYKGMKPTKEEIENKGPKLWLIQIYYESRKGASRLMKVMHDGKEIMVQFEPVRTFKDEEEAMKYAKENSITDIKLEEEK
ncbi:MAG: hypothetical protein ACHQIH_01770 [Ignavibacteria bacterium]